MWQRTKQVVTIKMVAQ